jgi:hypothetical protein
MGNPMFLSDIMNQDGFIFTVLTQVGQGMQGVLGLFGKHDQK